MRQGRWWWAVAMAALPAVAVGQTGPSFDCAQKLTSTVEQRICKDEKLAALDRELADVYATAWTKTTAADAQSLTLAQRAWIKTRNDCWKTQDVPHCVGTSYHDRISELQARYRLVDPIGSARYLCPGPPPQAASANYFATDPPTAMVEFMGATQFMRVAESGSGARYAGGGRQVWEHQGAALITWSKGREQTCPKQK